MVNHRSLIVCILSVTALLTVSACGQDTATDPNGKPGSSSEQDDRTERSDEPSPRSPSPNESTEPLDPPDPSDEPVRPEPRKPNGLIRIDWVEPRPESDSSTDRLRVHYQLPTPCSPGLQRVEVEETSSDVTIALHREPERKNDDLECAEVIVEESTRVTLDRPLGDRTVRDARSAESVRIGQ